MSKPSLGLAAQGLVRPGMRRGGAREEGGGGTVVLHEGSWEVRYVLPLWAVRG